MRKPEPPADTYIMVNLGYSAYSGDYVMDLD